MLVACRNEPMFPTPTAGPGPSPTPVLVEEVPGYDDPTRWDGETLVITSWGGEYQEAQNRAFFEPFARLTGATVELDETDIGELRSQVDSGEVSWGVCDVLTEDVLPLANLGAIAPIDYGAIDTDQILSIAMLEHGLASSFHSTILAYRTDHWDHGLVPAGWLDFWDFETFPGARGLHRDPQATLEFALLADGVPVEDLYPIDVERALASLDRVRPSVFLWWEQGAQPTQMITAGDMHLVSVWNSRIERISADGAPVEIQWNGGAISGESWVIPNGAPNMELALDFLNFASRPETCAAFSSLVPFGPPNTDTFRLLSPEQTARLPTSPDLLPLQFPIDHEWWFTNREAVTDEFEEWLAEVP